MDVITVRGRRFTVERATIEDLAQLVDLLREDDLGAARETAPSSAYSQAFAAIDGDPSHFLACVRDARGAVVGTMQLTLLPSLARGGTTRLHIEAVRVRADARGGGLGRAMLDWAHDFGRRHGATLAQLTSDKRREAAHRFYLGLGYEASHEGFKRPL